MTRPAFPPTCRTLEFDSEKLPLALLAELHVLADDRVELHEDESVRIVAAILPGHVRLPGASSRPHLDDWSQILRCACHLELLSLCDQPGNDVVDALLVDDLDSFGADGQRDVAAEAGNPVALPLNVDVEATLSAPVRVGDRVTEPGPRASHLTNA